MARLQPQAIGIIDGYFDTMPSIWHKEILWAMRQGVHVSGSASMGALRAAELAAFGMEGVGAIFDAYRSGELEDDDEVAVVHAPAEKGYRALSMAMVNIRATLAAAEAQQIVRPATRAALVQLAKEHVLPRSQLPTAAGGCGGNTDSTPRSLEALRAWLPGGQVDQKREDALAMLRAIGERLAVGRGQSRFAIILSTRSFGSMFARQQEMPFQRRRRTMPIRRRTSCSTRRASTRRPTSWRARARSPARWRRR